MPWQTFNGQGFLHFPALCVIVASTLWGVLSALCFSMILFHCGNLFAASLVASPSGQQFECGCLDMLHFDIPDSGFYLPLHRHCQAMFQKTVPKGETIIKCA